MTDGIHSPHPVVFFRGEPVIYQRDGDVLEALPLGGGTLLVMTPELRALIEDDERRLAAKGGAT